MARPDLTSASDERLVAVYVDAAADPSTRQRAFHLIVERYDRRLFAVCYRVLGSRQDAEDAVQETLLRLARSADGFRGDAKLSTWLYRVARNVCTDHVRYDARRPSIPVDDVGATDADLAAEDVLAARDTALTLAGALSALDDVSRKLLLMVAVDGLSYAEVADLTGIAIGTVKSRVSRARVRLGSLLSTGADEASPGAPAAERPPARGPSARRAGRDPPERQARGD